MAMVMCVNERNLPRGVGLNSYGNLFNWNIMIFAIIFRTFRKPLSYRKFSTISYEIRILCQMAKETVRTHTHNMATDWRR